MNVVILYCYNLSSIFTDVAAEKTQQTLIAGIETFDPTSLKHTTTQEKNPLPDKDGKYTFKLITKTFTNYLIISTTCYYYSII